MTKRKYISIFLAILHLAFIILPEIQVWVYISMQLETNYSVNITVHNHSSAPLKGDIAYLNALLARSEENGHTESKPKFPENNLSHTSLIYLPGEAILILEVPIKTFTNQYNRKSFFQSWLKNTPSPPPKSSFC